MRIRNVQRHDARLRRQLDAIRLAREQVKALAAAGKGAGDSADSLTAITVQLVQQQVLSILLQVAQPESSDQTEIADDQPKTLDLRDLQRLTRIIVDLNRVTNGSHQRAGKAAHTGKAAADVSAEPKQRGLSEEAYHMIRNILLEPHPVEAYSGDYPPDQTDTTPAEPVATPAEPAEAPAESTPPVADYPAPAEARPNSPEVTQPELTAAPRIYPHNKLYRVSTRRSASGAEQRSPRRAHTIWTTSPTGPGPRLSTPSLSVIPGPR